MGSVIRPSTGQPQIPVEHQTVIIVDKEGVPQAVGSPGGGGATANDIGAATNAAMKSSNQPISATALPLPSGAATEVTQLAVLAQLQGDRAITSNLFIDSTSTTYLRVLAFNQQTNTYEATVLTLAGAPYTPVPPETSLAKSDLDTTETSWEIRVSGTGYTVGDIVSQFNFLSQSPPAVIATLWFNQTTQLALASAPLAAHRQRTDGLAATEATLATRALESGGNLASINAKIPASLTPFRTENLLATAQVIKASAGKIHGFNLINTNTSPVYVKFFNVAAPTVGTTAPQKTIAVPANGFVFVEPQLIGIDFLTAISVAATTTPLTAGNTAPSTGLICEVEYI